MTHAELLALVDRVLRDPPVFVNGRHVGSTRTLAGLPVLATPVVPYGEVRVRTDCEVS